MDARPSHPAADAVPPRVRWLAWLVAAQAVAMLVYAGLTAVLAATGDERNWGAVAFVVVVLSLWGAGLLYVSRRGLPGARRWAFSPVMFTQAMFGIIAIGFLTASGNPPLAVASWLLVLASALVGLVWLFSAEVRHTLVPPTPPGR